MKVKFLIFFLFIFQYSFGQTDSLTFKESTYIVGNPYRTIFKSIKKSNDLIDVYFFKQHYYLFYSLPTELTNKELKNHKIEKWAFENTPENSNSNWKNTYEYDSEGKLISYSYSSCLTCSQISYHYKLLYNKKNQIIKQIKIGFKGKILEEVLLEYDIEGNIIKLEKYGQDKQIEQIIVLTSE